MSERDQIARLLEMKNLTRDMLTGMVEHLRAKLTAAEQELAALREDKAVNDAIKTLSLDGFETSDAANFQETLWYIVNPAIPFEPDALYDCESLQAFLCATIEQKRQAIDTARKEGK